MSEDSGGQMDKIRIEQAVIVEGRDDESVVRRACDAMVIVTHGFGISKETWELISKAYQEKGIIILTDPDYSGEEIRRKISGRFPGAWQANVPRERSEKNGDIGIENASPEDVQRALLLARRPAARGAGAEHGGRGCHVESAAPSGAGDSRAAAPVTLAELEALGLDGVTGARVLRTRAAAKLGIGNCNVKTFLRRVNAFGITAEELRRAICDDDREDDRA